MKSGERRNYAGVQIALHWLTALIILGMIPVGLTMTRIDGGMTKNLLYELHKSFGLIVIGLTIVRLATRAMMGAPAMAAGMPGWQRFAAHATHWAIYLLLVLVPLSGWAATSACCAPVNLFWSIPLTLPVGGGFETAKQIFLAHNVLSIALAGLLLLHAAAALHHHYVKRDDTLRRMLGRAR